MTFDLSEGHHHVKLAPAHSGPESSQSWPKIKIAECDFLYFFRSLEKENILKYMIISIFNFSKEFKAVIYACKHEKNMTFAQKLIKAATLKTAWWRDEGESIEGLLLGSTT